MSDQSQSARDERLAEFEQLAAGPNGYYRVAQIYNERLFRTGQQGAVSMSIIRMIAAILRAEFPSDGPV